MTAGVHRYSTVVRPNFGHSRSQSRGDRVIRGLTVDPQIVETALGVDRAAIAALSDAELLVLADAVGVAVGEEFVKVSDREKAIERKMANELNDEYAEGADEAIERELAGLPADGDILPDEAALAVSGVGSRLEKDLEGSRGTRILDALLTGVAALTLIARKTGKALVGATGRPTKSIGGSLTQVDRNAVGVLAEQQLWWIGKLWNEHLSKTISATITRESLVAGLGREAVGRIVRGVVSGTIPGVRVPGTWTGSTEQYFTSLAGTVRNQASNYGIITTFVEGGVDRYRIVAVLDKRTSEICNFMHGRTFSVRTGAQLATDRLDADSPEAVKNLSPWRSASSAENIAGGKDPEGALAQAGMALPPYHGSCRTTIEPE